MAEKKSRTGRFTPKPKSWHRFFRYLALILVALLFIAPVYWMIASSLKPDYEIFALPAKWWPSEPRWQNYPEALSQLPFGRFAINTLIIAISTIIGHLISCTIVAYGFARFKAPGSGFFFIVLLSTLMLPYPVIMVPLYIIFSRLGWVKFVPAIDCTRLLWECVLHLLIAPIVPPDPR